MRKPAPQPPKPIDVVKVDDATMRDFAGYQIKRAFNVIQDDLAKTLKPFELRMLTYTALVLIVDNPGMRQSQLADAMDIERPNLVVLLDELERRELVIRDRVPTDRRAYALKATLAGRRLYEKSVAAVTAHEERLLRDVDEGALTTMLAALNAIEQAKRRN